MQHTARTARSACSSQRAQHAAHSVHSTQRMQLERLATAASAARAAGSSCQQLGALCPHVHTCYARCPAGHAAPPLSAPALRLPRTLFIYCPQFGGQAPGTDEEERAAAFYKFGTEDFDVYDHILVNGACRGRLQHNLLTRAMTRATAKTNHRICTAKNRPPMKPLAAALAPAAASPIALFQALTHHTLTHTHHTLTHTLHTQPHMPGPDAHPLYKLLKAALPEDAPGSQRPMPGAERGSITWNYVR